jgi:hypothetical protein
VSHERLASVREAGGLTGLTRVTGGDAHDANPSDTIGAAA